MDTGNGHAWTLHLLKQAYIIIHVQRFNDRQYKGGDEWDVQYVTTTVQFFVKGLSLCYYRPKLNKDISCSIQY